MTVSALVTSQSTQPELTEPLTSLGRRALRGQVARFAVIGLGSTALHLTLLAALTTPVGTQAANFVGLVVSTLANTAANRAWTFQVHGTDRMARQHLQALVVFAMTWATSSGALALLALVVPGASAMVSVAVVGSANAVSTVARFAAMRCWIFRPAPRSAIRPAYRAERTGRALDLRP